MPREMSLTSDRPVTLPALVQAGLAVDGTLAPRTLFGGWAIQLVATDRSGAQSTEAPSTESPSTESPSTESPSTESPSTESPADLQDGDRNEVGGPGDEVAVLTLELSRRIDDRYDLERLVGPVPLGPDSEVWFTEATAPWGPYGEIGVRIVRELGALLGARVVVEEGR